MSFPIVQEAIVQEAIVQEAIVQEAIVTKPSSAVTGPSWSSPVIDERDSKIQV